GRAHGDGSERRRAPPSPRHGGCRRAPRLPHCRPAIPRGPGPMIVSGTVRLPGDKSITHRALLLSALARGTSYVGGALTSLDARSSARVLRQVGAVTSALRPGGIVTVRGRSRFRRPGDTLD